MKYIFTLVIFLQIINAKNIDRIIEAIENGGKEREAILEILSGTLNNYDKLIPHLVKILQTEEVDNHYRISRIVANRANDKIAWKKAFFEIVKDPSYSENLRVDLIHSICNKTEHSSFIIPKLLELFEDYFRSNKYKKIQSSCLSSINYLSYHDGQIDTELHEEIAKLMYKVIISNDKNLKFNAIVCLSRAGAQGQKYIKKIFDLSKIKRELTPLIITIFDKLDESSKRKKKYLQDVLLEQDQHFIKNILELFHSKNYEFFPVIENLLGSSNESIKEQAIETVFRLYSERPDFIILIKKHKDDNDFQKNIIEFFIHNEVPKSFKNFVIKGLYSKQKLTEYNSIIVLRKNIPTKNVIDEIAKFIDRTSYEENADFAKWTLKVLSRRTTVPNEMKQYIGKILKRLKY